MRELGWVPGQNIAPERRYGQSLAELHTAAAELVRLKVDVIVVTTGGMAAVVVQETRTIPIVVGGGSNLVGAGLVASLARPGGNVTGIQGLGDDAIGKNLELLQALLPNLARVASMRDNITWSAVPQVGSSFDQQAAIASRTLGITLHPIVVQQAGELTTAFLDVLKNRDQGLIVTGSPFMNLHRKVVVELAAKHRIPTIYDSRPFVDAGGLKFFGANFAENLRRLASYTDRILRGAKPADMPVEQPSKFDFIINLKTAKALGLTIPPSILARADPVIQ